MNDLLTLVCVEYPFVDKDRVFWDAFAYFEIRIKWKMFVTLHDHYIATGSLPETVSDYCLLILAHKLVYR